MSIYVAIEALRFFQVKQFLNDPELVKKKDSSEKFGGIKNKVTLQRQVMINKPNILENLGAIQIIVTDKTGTLTTSRLILRSIFCQGKIWGVCENSTQLNDLGYQIPDK